MTELSPEDISRAREMALPLAVELTPFEPGDDPYKRNVAEIQQDIANAMLAYSAAENERLTLERDRLKGALQDMLKLAKMLIRYTSENPSITQGWRTRIEAAEAALRPEGE